MITPPLNISAKPVLTLVVPVSRLVEPSLSCWPCVISVSFRPCRHLTAWSSMLPTGRTAIAYSVSRRERAPWGHVVTSRPACNEPPRVTVNRRAERFTVEERGAAHLVRRERPLPAVAGRDGPVARAGRRGDGPTDTGEPRRRALAAVPRALPHPEGAR